MDQRLKAATVIDFGDRAAVREPPLTSAELAEYRRLLPLLMKLAEEWASVTDSGGCPVARQILRGR